MNFALIKNKNFSFWISLTIILLNKNSFGQNIKTYELLLTEIMSDPTPVVHLPNDEFIEIYNNSKHSLIETLPPILNMDTVFQYPQTF